MSADHSTVAEQAAPATGLAAYREVMGTPGAWPVAIASLLARMPNAMSGVALVLFLHEETGSFASAGLATGAFVIGMGGTGPVLARMIDRRGAPIVILGGGLLASASLVAIFTVGRAGAGPGVIAALAVVAGGAMPPIGSVSRRRWAGLVPADRLPTAYAVEAILLEVIFIAGPALAGLIAGTLGAGDALLVAAGIGAVGSVWIATLVGSAASPGDAGEAPARHWAGALRFPLIRLLIATGLLMGGGIGALEIALPAFGAAHGNAALGGPYGAAMGVGSLCLGAVYGARSGTFGSPGRALIVLTALQGLTCLPMLAIGGTAAMFPAAVLAGSFWAPMNTVRSRLIQARVDAATVIEAFTWDGLSETVGASISLAAVGPLIAATSWRSGVIVACAIPVAGALVAYLGRASADPALPATHRAASG
jgi:Major Facilitator Superfamily